MYIPVWYVCRYVHRVGTPYVPESSHGVWHEKSSEVMKATWSSEMTLLKDVMKNYFAKISNEKS